MEKKRETLAITQTNKACGANNFVVKVLKNMPIISKFLPTILRAN